jgi:hypothetical protein
MADMIRLPVDLLQSLLHTISVDPRPVLGATSYHHMIQVILVLFIVLVQILKALFGWLRTIFFMSMIFAELLKGSGLLEVAGLLC